MEADCNKLFQMLRRHLAWYPLMQPRDAYKLIYQGTMGPEHIVPTQQEFAHNLELEFQKVLPDPSGQIFESIRPDNRLYRLNLAPYKVHHKDIQRLIDPLLGTCKLFTGNRAELIDSWTCFVNLCDRKELAGFSISDVKQLSDWLERNDYAAVHHSEVYRQAYQPAYRLILANYISEVEADAATRI